MGAGERIVMPNSAHRVLLLGLDGATFDLLVPRAAQGRLPNFKYLLDQGAHGVLRSTLPPYTAPAWTSLATGKNPGKHGIVDFWPRGRPGEPRTPISYRSIRTPMLWDYINAAGLEVGLVDVPVTYPPPPVKGFVVSGLLTPGRHVPYTHPRSLQTEIETIVPDYEPDPYEDIPAEGFLLKALEWIDKKEQVVHYLLDRHPVDFFFDVVRAPDVIQHRYWNCLDRDHPLYDPDKAARYGALLERCFFRIDEIIGDRLNRLDERTTLLVVSDHGFGPAYRYFHLNKFLQETGLLVLKRAVSNPILDRIRRAGITADELAHLLRKLDPLGLRWRLKNRTRMRFRSTLDRHLIQQIDQEKTIAWSGGITGEFVYLKPGVPPSQRESLVRALESLRDPIGGLPVFDWVYRKEEAYPGARSPDLPDIILDIGTRPYLLTERLGVPRVFQDLSSDDWCGRHQPGGILLALGRGIRTTSLEPHALVDIAPSILNLLGVPVPSDMDGQIMLDLFDDDFRRANSPWEAEPLALSPPTAASHFYSDDETSQISRRLAALGYLG